jgi:LemA protein
MSTLIAVIGPIAAIAVALGIAYSVSYNRLVTARNEVADTWSSVDIELERRHELIPRLVQSVSAAAAHERELLVELARRNEQAADTQHTVEAANHWEPPLADALARVVALRERYPQLNSQRNFLDLQQQLGLTEDRIAAARRFYNTRVEAYNRRTEAVPSAWVANAHGFNRASFFEA